MGLVRVGTKKDPDSEPAAVWNGALVLEPSLRPRLSRNFVFANCSLRTKTFCNFPSNMLEINFKNRGGQCILPCPG